MAIDRSFYNTKTIPEIELLLKQSGERVTYLKKILEEKRS